MNVLMDYAPLILWAVAAVLIIRNERRRRRAYAAERAHLAVLMRLAWMMVNDRPSKVIYWTKAEVDASPDEPHLVMEKSPNGYALHARTEPLDNPDVPAIEVG